MCDINGYNLEPYYNIKLLEYGPRLQVRSAGQAVVNGDCDTTVSMST